MTNTETNNRISELYELAYSLGLCYSEVQLLADKQFGKHLEKFDGAELDALRIWIKKNWFRKMQILDPEQHEQLMRIEDKRYSDWFTAEERKHSEAKEYVK